MHLWTAEPGGGAGGDIPCSVTRATNIWGCMYDVYTALMKMFSLQKGRHLSCLSCLLNLLTSPNNQCMRMSPTLGQRGARFQQLEKKVIWGGSLGSFIMILLCWRLPGPISSRTWDLHSLSRAPNVRSFGQTGCTVAPRLSKRDNKQQGFVSLFYFLPFLFICFLRP